MAHTRVLFPHQLAQQSTSNLIPTCVVFSALSGGCTRISLPSIHSPLLPMVGEALKGRIKIEQNCNHSSVWSCARQKCGYYSVSLYNHGNGRFFHSESRDSAPTHLGRSGVHACVHSLGIVRRCGCVGSSQVNHASIACHGFESATLKPMPSVLRSQAVSCHKATSRGTNRSVADGIMQRCSAIAMRDPYACPRPSTLAQPC